ncbi:MAG: hypothetical protein PHT94_03505 [Candidatus Nanoarchaeia archaeon]|nr:hypothetical protein [Candidatus Nanoarchaeia archaeon]
MQYIGSKKDLDSIIDFIINKDIDLEPVSLKNSSRINLLEFKEEIYRKKRQLNIHNQESKEILDKFHRFSKINKIGLRNPKLYTLNILKDLKIREYKEKVEKTIFSYIAGKNNSLKFKEMFYVLENYKKEYETFVEEFEKLNTLFVNGKIINNELKKKSYLKSSQINIIKPQKGYFTSISKLLEKNLIYKIENKDYLIVFSFYSSKEIVDSLSSTKTIEKFYKYDLNINFKTLKNSLKDYKKKIENLYKRLIHINYKSNFIKKKLIKLQSKLRTLKNIYITKTMVIFSTNKNLKLEHNILFALNDLSEQDIKILNNKTQLYLSKEYEKQLNLINIEKEKVKYELEFKKQEFLNDLDNKLNTQKNVYEESQKVNFDKFYSGFEDYLLTSKRFSEYFCKKIKKITNEDDSVIFKANPEVVHFFNEILLVNNIIVTIFLDYSEKGLSCYKDNRKIFEFEFSMLENYVREVYEKL